MSRERPSFLDEIKTEPKYFIDYEAFKKQEVNPPKSIVEDLIVPPPKEPAPVSKPKTVVPAKPAFEYKPEVKAKDLSPTPSQRSDNSFSRDSGRKFDTKVS